MQPVVTCFFAMLIALTLSGCSSVSSSPDSVQTGIQEMVAKKFATYKSANGLPETVGILVHLHTPKGTWTAASGLPSGSNQHWHYRIASVSKTITAASIMLLDQQGRLNIDHRITDSIPGTATPYLPDTGDYAIPFKDQITIRQLLSHRAGVYDVFNSPIQKAPYNGYPYGDYVKSVLNDPNHQFSIDELAGVIAANQLYYTEEQRNNGYKYSDTGYSLLAKIIERVSGRSYEQFITENFLTPMGLTQTTAPWKASDNRLPEPYFTGYVRLNSGSGFSDATEFNMSDQVGPGNIISTPADMGSWIRTLLSGRGPLTKEQIARMTAVQAGNKTYALGVGSNAVGIGHSGAHPGYINLVSYNPDDDVSVVVLTPFIDYSKLEGHLALITDIAKEARRIAGYPALWTTQ